MGSKRPEEEEGRLKAVDHRFGKVVRERSVQLLVRSEEAAPPSPTISSSSIRFCHAAALSPPIAPLLTIRSMLLRVCTAGKSRGPIGSLVIGAT